MKLAIGAVIAGLALKEGLKNRLNGKENIEIIDIGVYSSDKFVLYTDIVCKMANIITKKEADRGILICSTGMGMAIAANKYKGIMAACCESLYSAWGSRVYNNSNVLTLGEGIIGLEMAIKMVDVWLKTDFKDASVSDELKNNWQKMIDKISMMGENPDNTSC